MNMQNTDSHPTTLRRLLIIVICLAGLAWPGLSAYAGSRFVRGFDDLPLMPGMTELPGELMAFDSPAGRIVENSVRGNLGKQAVQTFYAATLPQLGWVQAGPHLFIREEETLKLEFLPPEGISISGQANDTPSLTVRFSLYPTEK